MKNGVKLLVLLMVAMLSQAVHQSVQAAETWQPRQPQDLLVVLVNFQDVKITTSREQWQDRFFGNKKKIINEQGVLENFDSVNDYYKENSDNHFYFRPAKEREGIENDGIVTLTIDKNHPNNNRQAEETVDIAILNKIKSMGENAAYKIVNFSDYDKNNNKCIDRDELTIVAVWAGSTDRLRAVTYHSLKFTDNKVNVKVMANVTELESLRVTPSPLPNASPTPTPLPQATWAPEPTIYMERLLPGGTICHEIGHCLGLPDMYSERSGESFGGTGAHTLMSHGHKGKLMVHLDAYSKIKLNFVKPLEVKLSGKYRVSSFNSLNKQTILKINIPGSPKKYYLVENRH